MLCLAMLLGACTSDGYYSGGSAYTAHAYSRPYTYPSSGTAYSRGTTERYSDTYGYPSGATSLPYTAYYHRYRDYPRAIYYGRSGDYRPYQYYRPYQFYRPYRYYRHRPYNYYRYRPHQKRRHANLVGKPYRKHHRGNSFRHRAHGDFGRGIYRINERRDIRGDRGAHSTRHKQRGYSTGTEHRLQQRYRTRDGRRAHQRRRAGNIERSYRGRLRHGTDFRGHRPAGPGRRR
ncbi:hypothetical protein [Microbulbifer marinus]|nr:hypothetical protein [Microbulbifer marinus]